MSSPPIRVQMFRVGIIAAVGVVSGLTVGYTQFPGKFGTMVTGSFVGIGGFVWGLYYAEELWEPVEEQLFGYGNAQEESE